MTAASAFGTVIAPHSVRLSDILRPSARPSASVRPSASCLRDGQMIDLECLAAPLAAPATKERKKAATVTALLADDLCAESEIN